MGAIVDQVLERSRAQAKASEGGIARGLPAAAYTSEEFFKAEQELVFARNWVFAGFAHELKQPGTAIPIEVAGQPLLILSDERGGIGVFHNVCRHRGVKLVMEPCMIRQSIVCPYHAWSYDLSGQLESSPHFGGFRVQEPAGFKRSDFGLKPARFAIWHDWIFVNLDGKAPDFSDYAASFAEVLGGVRYEQLEPIGKIDLGDVQCNWKFLMENFIEPYHVPIVHSKTAEGQPLRDHYTIAKGRCIGSGVDVDGPERGGQLAGYLDMSARYLSLFPNFVLGVYLPDQSGVHLNIPVSAGVTRQYRVLYSINGRQYSAEEREKLCALWRDVHKEDHGVCERLQAGRASSVMQGDGGVLSPHWEDSLHAFQSMVMQSMA